MEEMLTLDLDELMSSFQKSLNKPFLVLILSLFMIEKKLDLETSV